MDVNGLVEGGAKGIEQIASAFREVGVLVSAAYLIQVPVEESVMWKVRLVTQKTLREVILIRIKLEREGKLPAIDRDVAITPISPDSWEARSILDYASKAASDPVELRNTGIDGILIPYALVPKLPAPDRAAA